MLIIHIVPQLPPQNSGVGDYAALVGRRMEEIGGVACAFVAAGCNAVELPANGPCIRNITGACSSAILWNAVKELAAEVGNGQVSIVLNYSGYGYERHGCPAWLSDALRTRPEVVTRVVTYFHELFADGWPWQRAFWYSRRQQRVAADIARLSDVVLTNREQSARWLEDRSGRPAGSIASLPTPSNVGEPAEVPGYESRPPRGVVFGGKRSKRFALSAEAQRVAVILERLRICELVDIGGPSAIDARVFERANITIRRTGFLGATEINRELLQCRVGFLDYPLAFLAKSSVFAAYAAHGIVPVLRHATDGTFDGISLGRQALWLGSMRETAGDISQLRQISEQAFAWYRRCGTEIHARALLDGQTVAPPSASFQSCLR